MKIPPNKWINLTCYSGLFLRGFAIFTSEKPAITRRLSWRYAAENSVTYNLWNEGQGIDPSAGE
ncbi:MAG: hypothetical protein RIC85_01105 [Gammaproteobacteria bacterium]